MTTDADFGLDIATPDAMDIDPFFSLVDGYTALAQALARRITTPRGGLIDDPEYGHDVREFLNEVSPSPSAVAIAVRNEWLRDERVLDARVQATFEDETLSIVGRIETGDGPFTLTLAISAVTVETLRVEAA